jgi:hypothetical protein
MSEKELTPKQLRFCEELLIDDNQTQAAERAGYSKKTAAEQGSRLFRNVKIQARMKELRDARSQRTGIDAAYVLTTIQETIERCRQAVPVEEFDYETKTMIKTGEFKFEHMGVLKGCELLGRHLKMWTDVKEIRRGGLAEKMAKARARKKGSE